MFFIQFYSVGVNLNHDVLSLLIFGPGRSHENLIFLFIFDIGMVMRTVMLCTLYFSCKIFMLIKINLLCIYINIYLLIFYLKIVYILTILYYC